MAVFSWNGTAGDWSTPGLWAGDAVPNDVSADVTIAALGAYTVAIAAGESFTVDLVDQTQGTLAVSGTLVLSGGTSTLSDATVASGGLLTGAGTVNIAASGIVNHGTVQADGGNLTFVGTTFDNQGTLAAANAGILLVAATGSFPEQTGTGTLTAGSYLVSGNGSAIDLFAFSGTAAVVTDAATITLVGPGADVLGYDSVAAQYVTLEASLATIAAGGALNLLADRGFASTTGTALVDNGLLTLAGGTLSVSGLNIGATGTLAGAGTVTGAVANGGTLTANGGTLALPAGVSGAGVVTIDAGAILSLPTSTLGAITDNGTVRADSGTLTLSGAIGGSGALQVNSGATLDLAAGFSGAVSFYGGAAVLDLVTPASFAGRLIGFETTDTVDLAGLSFSGATLSPAGTSVMLTGTSGPYTLALGADYAGETFSVAPHPGGGTDLTVSGVNYALEGPNWAGKTITWSFATSNLPADSAHPFSSFVDPAGQAAFATLFENALAEWASIAGFNFVQVANSATADLRIGWGDFTGGGGEIGQAAFGFDPATELMNPDAIVRVQDPSLLSVSLNGAGQYIYSGTSTAMYQVMLHEIGHALGLGHSTDSSAVMFPTATPSNENVDVSDIAGMTALYAAIPCFAAGTRLLAAEGEMAVERLRVGDALPTLLGGVRRVRWIGRRRIAPARHPRPWDVQPVRVRAHAFGPCAPARDLVLSPDHAVFADGVLVPVRYLVNGASVVQEAVEAVTYFHVELADAAGAATHDVVLAEGLAVESYLDTGNRTSFDGGAVTAAAPRFGRPDDALGVWAARGCAPLAVEGAAVAALRGRLIDRAPALGFVLEDDPDLHLWLDGARLDAVKQGAVHRFAVPRGGVVLLRSRAERPAHVLADAHDMRRLGVAVAAIAVDGRPVGLDDARLGAGFYPLERDAAASWRWTDGAAALRLDGLCALDVTLALSLPAWRRRAG